MASKDRAHAVTRVAVVDDDKDTRLYFKDILESSRDFDFAGEFSNGITALVGVQALRPDLILMDFRMPELDGMECTRRLKHSMPQLKIIIMTGVHDVELVGYGLQAGADNYLIKPVTVDQCLATLTFVSVGSAQIQSEEEMSIQNAILPKHRGELSLLSPREFEVLHCLAEGLLYKEIAEQLQISYGAVHKYQHSIFQKLHVSNRSEAIRKWMERDGK